MGKDFISDPEGFDDIEAMRMRILLQQGDVRIYIIRPSTGGKETLPCQSFENITKIEGKAKHIQSFRDICPDIVRGSWIPEMPVRAVPDISRAPSKEWPSELRFSKTDYNKYCDCPLKFAYHHIMHNQFEQNTRALFGTFIHEFAEFSYCFPELAEERFDAYMDRLLGKYSGISSSCLSRIDEAKFRVVMRNVMRFVVQLRPHGLTLDRDNSSRDHPNALIAEETDTGGRCSSDTESDMESMEGHRFGAQLDLSLPPQIYDWKTGRAKKCGDIESGFCSIGSKNPAETQPILYIKAMEENHPGWNEYEFNLVYFGDCIVEKQIRGTSDVSDSIRKVVFWAGSIADFLFRYGVVDGEIDKRTRRA